MRRDSVERWRALHHFDDDSWWIRELDLEKRRIRTIAPLPAADVYHAWSPDGALLSAWGSAIYRWDGRAWVVLAELGQGAEVSRIAVSRDGGRLAAVVAR